MPKLLIALFCCSFFICTPAWSHEEDTTHGPDDEKDVIKKKDPTYTPKDGASVIPVIAANSTYGAMLGGAVIVYKPLQHRHKFLLIALATKVGQTYTLFEYDRGGSVWSQGIRVLANNFFDTYYGESRAVRKDPPDQLVTKTFKFRTYLEYRLRQSLGLQFLWDGRWRRETGGLILANGQHVDRQVYPNERTNAFGLALNFDNRYEPRFSTLGTYASAKVLRMPGSIASDLPDAQPFTQLTLDLRYNHEIFPFLVLSERLYFGDTIGDPSWAFVYSFGGSNEMRGYGFARFVGSKFYIGQIEARFPVWGIFSGSVFYEAGDITRTTYEGLITDAGFGLKVALPPDYVAKLRIDMGFGREAPNFVMEADHAF